MMRKVNTYFLVYFIVVIGFITFPPTLKLVNRIEPLIFGIPFLQVFIIFDAILIGAGLMVWFVIEDRVEKEAKLSRPLDKEVKM